jgi:hypothetical protein
VSNPATVADLADRFWRPLTIREQTIGQTWLDDAYGLLAARLPLLEANVLAGTVQTNDVVRVVCAMVARVFGNPEGKNQEAIDDYSYRRADAVADGILRVTSDEIGDLTPGRKSNRSVRLIAYGETL